MSYFSHHRPEIQALVPINVKSLLDVGCGTGNFSRAIKDKTGCEVWGIEPVAMEAVEAKKVLDEVKIGFFEDVIDSIDKQFEVICFNDVLEHMPDPHQTLKMCIRVLGPGGIIIASMPNILHYQEFFDILIKKDFKYTDAGIMDRTHLRWFTRKSMIRMFEDCGFDVKKVQGLDPTPSKKMGLINALSFGYLDEMRYPQFALIAERRK